MDADDNESRKVRGLLTRLEADLDALEADLDAEANERNDLIKKVQQLQSDLRTAKSELETAKRATTQANQAMGWFVFIGVLMFCIRPGGLFQSRREFTLGDGATVYSRMVKYWGLSERDIPMELRCMECESHLPHCSKCDSEYYEWRTVGGVPLWN